MDRPRREAKAPVRLKPNHPVKDVAQPANKRQPITPQKPEEKFRAAAQTLNLDLLKNPPSYDQKFAEDWSLPDHLFWKDNFFTPQDNTTQNYMEATEKLINVPNSFVLMRGIDTSFGVAN
jgi:hypothetical protein